MKTKLGPIIALYPMPTVLVGAHVGGKPNFLTASHVGILNYAQPQYVSVGLGRVHYTNQGIRDSGAFSICIPSQDMLAEVDYCGIVSGRNTDKAALFDIFYGDSPHAPLIAQCPVCMECALHQVLELPTHEVFIGEVKQVHADEAVLTGETVDPGKVRPLLSDTCQRNYWALGPVVGKCWSAGKTLKKK